MQPDYHDLDVRINAAGALPSQINDAIAAAIQQGALPPEGYPLTDAILRPLRQVSAALAGIQGWSSAAQKSAPAAPVNHLPPGQVVADVGSVQQRYADEGDYSGPVDPATLTAENYAWMEQNMPTNKVGQIFSARPSYVAPDGHTYQPGELATIIRAGKATPQIPGGPSLADVIAAIP